MWLEGRFNLTLYFCYNINNYFLLTICQASNFGRIECTSCSNLDSMNNDNNIVIAGCGHVAYNGDIVYTNMPNPIFAP